MTSAVNVTFLLLKAVSCFTLQPVLWVMGDSEGLMGSGTGVCLSVVTLLSPGGPYWNKSKLWQNGAGITGRGECQIFYFILYCNIAIKHNYYYVLLLLDWRCCLIALNHPIVNHYEFLFANIKKSSGNLFTYSLLKISRDLLCFINATPGTAIQPTHPYWTFAKQPWQLEWQTQDLGNIHQIYTHLFASQRQKLHSTAHLCWRQMWAQV